MSVHGLTQVAEVGSCASCSLGPCLGYCAEEVFAAADKIVEGSSPILYYEGDLYKLLNSVINLIIL